MIFHFEFPPFPIGVLLWCSPLTSLWVKLSAREFFDPCICSIDKENELSHNCQRRSHPYAYIFDKFFFTKPSTPLQSVRVRKGFRAKKIKNVLISFITDRPQVYGRCSVDQVSSHRDYRELLSFSLLSLLGELKVEIRNWKW